MEEYINFKFIVKSVWRKFYIVTFLGIIGFVVGYLYNQSLPITTTYNATAKIYVKPNYDNKNDTSQDTLLATNQLAHTYAKLIKSRVVLENVAKDLSFSLDIQNLIDDLEVTSSIDNPIITIGYTAEVQEQAIEIIEKTYQAFLEDKAALEIENVSIIDKGSVYKKDTSLRSSKYAIMFTCVSTIIGIIIAFGLEILHNDKKSK